MRDMKPISGALPAVGQALASVTRGARERRFRAEMASAERLIARSALARALDLTAPYAIPGSERAPAMKLRALALMECCRYAEAEALWERLLVLEPGNGEARQGLRRAARARGETPEDGAAIQQLERAAASEGRWVTLREIDAAIAAGSPEVGKLRAQRERMLKNHYRVHADAPDGAAEGPADPCEAAVASARALARGGWWRDALRTLPADDESQACGDVRALRRDILIQEGAFRAGLLEAFAAFRAAPTPDNLVALARLLIDDARPKALTALLRNRMPARAMDYAPWRRALAQIFTAMGRPDAARSMALDAAALDPASLISHRLLASAEWLCGLKDAAWRRQLAAALDRPELIGDDSGFNDAAAEIAAVAAAADAAADDRLTEALLELRTSIADPYLLKLERPLTVAEAEALAALAAPGAATPDVFERVMRLTESYSEPRKCGHALRSVAQQAEAAGQLGAARRALESAVWKNKIHGGHALRLKRFMRANAPFLQVAGDAPRIAALMVTCAPNLSRAGRLASAFSMRTGLQVVTLSADQTLEMPTLADRPYGRHLTVPGDDLYLGLAQKMNAAYRYLAWCSDADAVLKIDDDVVAQAPEKLSALLGRLSAAGTDYAGKVSVFQNGAFHIGRHPDQHRSRSSHHAPRGYANGAMGYWMSRRAMEAVARLGLSYYADWKEEALYEDVYIGEVLAEAGIRPADVDMLAEGGLVADVFEAASAAKRLTETR